MIDVVLTINGQDFAPVLTSYKATQEIKFSDIIKTMDDTEHPFGETRRDVIEFQLMPGRENDNEDYIALMGRPMIVEYSTRNQGVKKQAFRLDCNLDDIYLLKNCYGDVYYNGGKIKLRALGVG